MKFERNNTKSKTVFYRLLILVEIVAYIAMIYIEVHWLLLMICFPFLLLELISNYRCLKRQKNFIKTIELENSVLKYTLSNNAIGEIPYQELRFSFREIKFEKDKSEIEIRHKKKFKSKLVGRLHIKNWSEIWVLKKELELKGIERVKFRPEGFWNKYGGLTADIVIIAGSYTLGEVAELSGNIGTSNDLNSLKYETNFNGFHKDHDVKK